MAADAVPLVGNPAAAGGRGGLRLREAEALLRLKGFATERFESGHPGHARVIVEGLARDGHRMLFVCGGDGTVSEAAQGVLASGRSPVLGFLPGGTGNDFLRDFGILDLAQAADRIALGSPHAVDAARVTTPLGIRHFVNVFGTGFMARAGDTANRRFKWLGRRAYTAGVLREVLRLRPSWTRLVLDGVEEEGPMAMVAVCNSAHTGGAMRIAPQAHPDDGVLDVMVVGDVGRAELLQVFPRIFDGSHVRHRKVRMARARRIRIEPGEPSPLLLDGEVADTTPVGIEVLPGALRVLL